MPKHMFPECITMYDAKVSSTEKAETEWTKVADTYTLRAVAPVSDCVSL